MKNIIKSVFVLLISISLFSCSTSKYFSDGKTTKIQGRAANTYVKKPKQGKTKTKTTINNGTGYSRRCYDWGTDFGNAGATIPPAGHSAFIMGAYDNRCIK